MSLRDREWRFERSVGDVHEAVEAKLSHHRERIRFWESEHERVMEEIRASGITVEAHEVTGGQRADVKIDVTLSRRLSECESKLSAHRSKRAELELWAAVLMEENRERPMDLDWQDVQFFFGAAVEEKVFA